MSKTRNSNVKKGTNERHDRSLWWFSEGENGLFIEKSIGRVKHKGEELLSVTKITASLQRRLDKQLSSCHVSSRPIRSLHFLIVFSNKFDQENLHSTRNK